MSRVVSLLLLSTALVACSKRPSTSEPTPPRPAQGVQAHGEPGAMHERLLAVTGARDRVIAGDLEGARASLQQVAEETVPAMAPQAWRPHLEDLRDAAAEGAEADTLATLARSVADAGRACGACHTDVGSGPRWVGQDVPAPEDQMGRHVWASDRMWEGLIGPGSGRWQSAALALADEVGHGGGLFQGLDLATTAAASRLHDRVHELGAAGGRVEISDEDRTSLYAAFIGACAECHTLTGRGPR